MSDGTSAAAGRIASLQARLDDLGWRGVFLPPGEDLRYVAGFTTAADERPAFLAVTRDRAGWLMPELNRAQAEAQTRSPMFCYSDADGPGAAACQLWGALGPTDGEGERFGVGDATRADFLLFLQSALPKARWSPASEAVAALRMVKDADEIARLERVARLTDRVVEAGFAAIRPGASEREVARAVRDAFAREGAEDILFCGVAAGVNSAFPHHHTSDTVIRPGDPLWLDIGCRVDDYCSDITRMAVVGEPPAEYRSVHDAVSAAVDAAFAAALPGARLADVDRAARGTITDAGYGEYFVHRTGHGLGLSGHELPSVHGKNETPIQEGMVFTIEPGVYLPGRFGVRIEEVAVVERGGARRLSRLSRDARQVPASGQGEGTRA